MSAALAYASHDFTRASHARLPKGLADLHKHYEASYFGFMCSLTEENPDIGKAKEKLIRFRIFRNFFMEELIRFAGKPGLITSLDDGDHLNTAVGARERLAGFFPGHTDRLAGIIDVPVSFLPFIKVLEDPMSEVLGQTFKLSPERSFMMVRSGSGREADTTMHEYLHTLVRGLPLIFEEGFCRHALQARGVEDSDLDSIWKMEDDELRVNFAGIQYPPLIVGMLSQAFGDSEVERSFFAQDVTELERRLGRSGIFAEMDAPHRKNLPREAAEHAMRLMAAIGSGISEGMRKSVERAYAVLAGDGKIPTM